MNRGFLFKHFVFIKYSLKEKETDATASAADNFKNIQKKISMNHLPPFKHTDPERSEQRQGDEKDRYRN